MAWGLGAHSLLPEELIHEIMWRLPVKSLFRFKCVCKNWYHLIQTPTFINDHYNCSNKRTRLLLHHHHQRCIVRSCSAKVCSMENFYPSQFTLFSDQTLSNTTIPEDIVNPLTPCDGTLYNIIGPVNGLFLVNYARHAAKYGRLALWNPATTEFRDLTLPSIISQPPTDFAASFTFHFSFGFGFDPLTGDFKVVVIPFTRDDGLRVQLYSLANDSWREIDSVLASSLTHICGTVWPNTYLNGAFYWLSRMHPTIVKFDMSKEVFLEIQTPPSFKIRALKAGQLILCNGSIALVQTRYSNEILECIEVWLLTKGEERWIKHSVIGLPQIPRLRPIGLWTNGEIIFDNHEKSSYHSQDSELVLYNPKNRNVRKLGMWLSFKVLNYKESLASVKGGSKLCPTSSGNNKKRKRMEFTEERCCKKFASTLLIC